MKAQEELCVALAKQSSIGVRLRRNEVDTLRLAAGRKRFFIIFHDPLTHDPSISRRWIMLSLGLRLSLLLAVLFGIVYAIVTMIMSYMGINNVGLYFFIAFGMMLLQYFIGPKIVEWTMGIKYLKKEDAPWLFEMVEDLAKKAGIPVPRIGISRSSVPNAFAFGRGHRDGRVCVTSGIVDLLNQEELKAVLGHELTHIKNRDVLFITILSVIPMILYRIFWQLTFFGGNNRRREGSQQGWIIGLAALVFYFITNLLVLYASRIREYFADKGSVTLGNKPTALASALYKLVYGSSRADQGDVKSMEGLKAFCLNDVSRAGTEIRQLSQLKLNKDGMLDSFELKSLKYKDIALTSGEKFMEVFSTHPNMLKRIKQLSTYN
jgi:heat shock protein HtpX